MTRGKRTCKTLKEIRQQIADNNEIEYITSECNFQGECKGTCPKCEAEVRYLEKELNKRRQLGKAVAIAGISLGMAGSFSACHAPNKDKTSISESGIEVLKHDTTIITEIYHRDYLGIPPPGGIGVEAFPEYQGGEEAFLKFLKENIEYPKEAQEKGIEGSVDIRFCIEEDGNLSEIKVLRDIGYGCGEEAVRVIKMMPKWEVAQIDGENVRMQYSIPIDFKLNDKK